MSAERTILLLPGDGIGPEIMQPVYRLLDWLAQYHGITFTVSERKIGGAALDAEGTPLSDATLAQAKSVDAILLGAVGGTKWNDVEFAKRPEAALLKIRKELDLYANFRPIIVFSSLIDASPLKPDIIRDLDILIVRELSSGVYFGQPRGIEQDQNGHFRAINTHSYTSQEIRRVARIAFDCARNRRKKLCSVDKANVMEAGQLWRQEVTALHQEAFSDITLTHMYADNCAMQLIRDPRQFDTIVTDNLFGDLLSDEAAMLTGSLGMLPSASFGDRTTKGYVRALYEPVHGSAPDIAGKDLVNPLATILSFIMMLRHSFGLKAEADLIDQAIKVILDRGLRTTDIMSPGMTLCKTSVMSDALISCLEQNTSHILEPTA